MTGKILIIKNEIDDFERFFSEKMNEYSNVTALKPYSSSSYIKKAFTFFNSPFSLRYLNGEIYKALEDADLVILFDFNGYDIVANEIVKLGKRVIVWHWNIIRKRKAILRLKRLNPLVEKWTFDKNDAQKYNMKLNTQFYFESDFRHNKDKYDVIFIGLDKGRVKLIKELNNMLKKSNYKTYIKIFSKRKKGSLYYNQFIEYNKIIKISNESKCILEIVQDNQSGVTLRTLEALYFRKKLVTNNKNLRELPFYNENNIFILKDDLSNFSDFDNFMNSKLVDVSKEIRDMFSFQSWLDNFDTIQ